MCFYTKLTPVCPTCGAQDGPIQHFQERCLQCTEEGLGFGQCTDAKRDGLWVQEPGRVRNHMQCLNCALLEEKKQEADAIRQQRMRPLELCIFSEDYNKYLVTVARQIRSGVQGAEEIEGKIRERVAVFQAVQLMVRNRRLEPFHKVHDYARKQIRREEKAAAEAAAEAAKAAEAERNEENEEDEDDGEIISEEDWLYMYGNLVGSVRVS